MCETRERKNGGRAQEETQLVHRSIYKTERLCVVKWGGLSESSGVILAEAPAQEAER